MLVTSSINAKKERDDMSMDTTNVLAQTESPQFDERIMMIIPGALVDMLLEIDPEKCQCLEIGDVRIKGLCAHMIKKQQGMLMAIVSYWKKCMKYIEAWGYQVNPHGIRVSNKIANDSQHKLT